MRRAGVAEWRGGQQGWADGDRCVVAVVQDVPQHLVADEVRCCFVHQWVPDELRPDEERLWVAVVPEAVADVLAATVTVASGSVDVVRLERDGHPVHVGLCDLAEVDVVSAMSQVLWDQRASSTNQLTIVADTCARIAASYGVPWWSVLGFVPDADCADLHELGVLANAAFGPPAERS